MPRSGGAARAEPVGPTPAIEHVWLHSPDCNRDVQALPAGDCVGETGLMAQAKKIALYMIIVFVLYTIITSPQRAAEMVQIGFEGISSAAQGVGQFMTQLIK